MRTITLSCSLGEVEAVAPTVDRRCRPRVANIRSETEEDGVNGNVEAMCSRGFETLIRCQRPFRVDGWRLSRCWKVTAGLLLLAGVSLSDIFCLLLPVIPSENADAQHRTRIEARI